MEKEKKETANNTCGLSRGRPATRRKDPDRKGKARWEDRESHVYNRDEYALTNWGILEERVREGKAFVGEKPDMWRRGPYPSAETPRVFQLEMKAGIPPFSEEDEPVLGGPTWQEPP